MSEKMEAEDIPMPEDLTPEQKDIYKRLWRASRMKDSGFQTAAIEVLSTNPDFTEKYLARHRDQTVEQVAAHLSESGPLLDMPVETIKAIIDLPIECLAHLVKATHILRNVDIRLEISDVKTAVDLAKVMKVMEAENEIVGEAEEGSQDDYLGPQMPEMDQMDGDNGTVPDHIIARRARVRLAAER